MFLLVLVLLGLLLLVLMLVLMVVLTVLLQSIKLLLLRVLMLVLLDAARAQKLVLTLLVLTLLVDRWLTDLSHGGEVNCNSTTGGVPCSCSSDSASDTRDGVLLVFLWLLLSPPARGWSCCSSARVGAAGARARHSESTAGCAGELKPSLRLCCRGVLLLAHFLFSFLRLTASSPCRPQVVKTRLMPVIRRDHALVSIRGACSCCFQITFWCVSSCVWLLRLAFLQLSTDASVASHVRQNFR
jgi:hypothetical protein